MRELIEPIAKEIALGRSGAQPDRVTAKLILDRLRSLGALKG
jgi:hypothetical protein